MCEWTPTIPPVPVLGTDELRGDGEHRSGPVRDDFA